VNLEDASVIERTYSVLHCFVGSNLSHLRVSNPCLLPCDCEHERESASVHDDEVWRGLTDSL
jgi:hypothetical protein